LEWVRIFWQKVKRSFSHIFTKAKPWTKDLNESSDKVHLRKVCKAIVKKKAIWSFNTDLLSMNVEFTNVHFGTLLWIFFCKIIVKNEAKHCFLLSWKNPEEPWFNFQGWDVFFPSFFVAVTVLCHRNKGHMYLYLWMIALKARPSFQDSVKFVTSTDG